MINDMHFQMMQRRSGIPLAKKLKLSSTSCLLSLTPTVAQTHSNIHTTGIEHHLLDVHFSLVMLTHMTLTTWLHAFMNFMGGGAPPSLQDTDGTSVQEDNTYQAGSSRSNLS